MTKCNTKTCDKPATWTVYWPGQTSPKCDVCKVQAERIALAMGFDVDSTPLPDDVPAP